MIAAADAAAEGTETKGNPKLVSDENVPEMAYKISIEYVINSYDMI